MAKLRALCIASVLALGSAIVSAQTVAARSPSGSWRVQILPGDGTQPARARLFDPQGGTRIYALGNEIAPAAALVLDDGSALYFDEWKMLGRGTVVDARDASGGRSWSRTLEQLVPAEALARVPASFGARNWRRGAPELRAVEGEPSRFEVRVELWNADELALDPRSGASRWIEIEDHGDDPDAWAASARDRLLAGKPGEAAAEFERALALAPDRVQLWDELAALWIGVGDDARAVNALERGVAKNPLGEETADRFSEASGRAWLSFQLARIYDRTGKVEEAQALVQRVLAVDPSSWPAAHLRAEWLAKQGAREELDALMARSFRALAGDPKDANRGRKLTQAALYVGGFYADEAHWKEAREYLARGLEGVWSEPLRVALARACVGLGERERAMELLTEVVEHLLVEQAKMPPEVAKRNEARVKELEAEIARLGGEGGK